MSPTSILTLVIVGLGILVVLVLAFSWAFARLWCKPKQEPLSKTPADYGLTFESIQFSSHGVPIRGWFIPAPGAPPHPAVTLTHGWSKNAAEMLPLAARLHQANLAVLLFSARGHGESGPDGPITVRKFAEDSIASVEYLEARPEVDKERVGLLGRSIGGSAAIIAASTEPRIRAVVTCSAFADPAALTRDYLKKLHIPAWPFSWLVGRFIERYLRTTFDDIAPYNRIAQITVPILLIHGDLDRLRPPSDMEFLCARARRECAEQLLITGRGHSDLMDDPRCIQEIVVFFSKHLGA